MNTADDITTHPMNETIATSCERTGAGNNTSPPRNVQTFDFWTKTLNGAKYVVAPMVDQSELAWRMLSRKYGAELCYSPMYHALNFIKDAKYRSEALKTCPEDRPLIIQFCANDPSVLLQAAKLAEKHCDAVDLNLGCPQTIAKKGRYGAFLQDNWDLVTALVRTCADNLSVPITCKIRVFESIERTVEYARCIEKAGCSLLTVHGRTREQKGMDTGIASWKHIKAVKENLNIPVFANGNIQYFDDIERCINETGVDGVMTAEGSLHNPKIFTGDAPPCWTMVDEYLDLVEKYPCPVSFIRGHVFKLCHYVLQHHHEIRDLFTEAKSAECFRLANSKLKDHVLNSHPPSVPFLTDNGLLYYLCQPYVRPKAADLEQPTETTKNAKRERLKRPLEKLYKDIDLSTLSTKMMKRMLKYPHKNHLHKTVTIRFDKCASCDNTKGSRCTNDLCRYCCRIKTASDILDCEAHRFFVKTKSDKELMSPANATDLQKVGELG